jgi:hypothetical protein
MARGKSKKLKPFEKLLTLMISGKLVTTEEIDATLGQEIHMYRLSTYIWHVKTFANGVVKVVKAGRKVAGYQLMNVDEVNNYMKNAGIDPSKFVVGQSVRIVRAKKTGATQTVVVAKEKDEKSSIEEMSDLKAKPLKKEKVDEVMEITEVQETV